MVIFAAAMLKLSKVVPRLILPKYDCRCRVTLPRSSDDSGAYMQDLAEYVTLLRQTSWHSVSPVFVNRPRCCISNYYFSKISPEESDCYHVTSFSGRSGQKMKKALGVLDNALRNVISRSLKITTGIRRKTLHE
jgi:hypothetical protein